MAHETEKKPSFGEAVDLLVKTLKAFDEKQQRTLVSTVCALLELKIAEPQAPQPPTVGTTPLASTPTPPPSGKDRPGEHTTDIRALREEKNPKSATQMAAVVGYYLKELAPEGERRDTLKTQDLEKYFKQAKYELPKKLEQVLIDSKRAGYFEVVTRGEYRLTRVGYNLVAHRLPEA